MTKMDEDKKKKKKMKVNGDGKKRDKEKNDTEVSFSLRDIQNTFPKESEEETMVLAHIEEINPVYDNGNDSDNDVYGKTATSSSVLPDDFVHSMQESKRNQMMMKEKMEAETKKPKSSQTDVTSSFIDKGEFTDDDDDDDDKMEEDNHGEKVDVEMGSRRFKRGQQPKLKSTTEEELYRYTSLIVSTRNSPDTRNESHTSKGGSGDDSNNDDNNNDEEENNDHVDGEEEEEEQESLTKSEKFAIFVGGRGNDGNGDGDRDQDGHGLRGNGFQSSIRQSFGEALHLVKFNSADTFKFIKNGLCYLIIPGFILAIYLYYGFFGSTWGGTYPPCFKSDTNLLNSAATQLASLTGTGTSDDDTSPNTIVYVDGNLTSLDTSSESDSPSMSPTTHPESAFETNYKCSGGTYSWWVLFGMRQFITYSLAAGLQFLLIAYYQNQRSRFILFGPAGRLFVLQAKGMALTLIFWGILDLILLYGNRPFVKHWLYFTQFDMFNNEKNSSGSPRSFIASADNLKILLYMISVGIAIALKRFTTAMQFAKASYSRYANQLSHVLKHISLIYKVARGSTQDQNDSFVYKGTDEKSFNIAVNKSIIDSMKNNDDIDSTKDSSLHHKDTGLGSILDSIEEWEEIELTTKKNEIEVSLSALVQYNCSIKILDSFYLFSYPFGYCFDRCSVLKNSQRLYLELTIESSDNAPLHFRTLALASMNKAGKLDEQELKDLIYVFRPNRDGTISMIDFCKSIDTVYKEIRKLRASIANESRMNVGAETGINCIFYAIMVLSGLFLVFDRTVGHDDVEEILAIFVALFTVAIPFAFCFGRAAGDFVIGIKFILVQRPYDIGDRIAITGASESISGTGRPQWLVTDVSLHHTTLVYDESQETATVANGAMAGMKILNGARSQNAQVSFTLLVDINSVIDQRIKTFKDELFKYVKSKPRQWLKPVAFRMNTHEADGSGCLEYEFTLQHRESWQQIGAIKDSKSDIRKFCFDLKQSLGMNGSIEIPSSPADNGSDDDGSCDDDNNEYGKNEANPLLLLVESTLL